MRGDLVLRLPQAAWPANQGGAHFQYLRTEDASGRVVSNFIVQALNNRPITIYGDGSQTRSFCYVDDLIDGLVRLMESPDSVTGPINIGNSSEFTIGELAELVIAETGSSASVEHLDLPPDDPKQRRPDISLAQETLGWIPKTEIIDGLKPTIAYFREVATGDLEAREAEET